MISHDIIPIIIISYRHNHIAISLVIVRTAPTERDLPHWGPSASRNGGSGNLHKIIGKTMDKYGKTMENYGTTMDNYGKHSKWRLLGKAINGGFV